MSRGWWDAPDGKVPQEATEPISPHSEKLAVPEDTLRPLPLGPFVLSDPPLGKSSPRKSSLRGDFSLPQPARRVSLAVDVSDLPIDGRRTRAVSPTPSTPSLLTKLMPRVSVFREAMRDEVSGSISSSRRIH
jgi:hypothetical protein